MSFPGQLQTIHLMNQFIGSDPKSSLPLTGGDALYEVTFILNRPGHRLMPDGQFSFSNGLEGDSHLAIKKPAFAPPGNPDATGIKFQVRNDDGQFEFTGLANQRDFLGKLVSAPFRAVNRAKAEEIAYRALAPSLSELSLHLDIPLEIYQHETRDTVTENIQTSVVIPYFPAPLAISLTSATIGDYRGAASLYREAMNSNSQIFAFLCLYKIIEMIRARRKGLARKAAQTGSTCAPPTEVMPSKLEETRLWLEKLFYARPAWDLMALESAVSKDVRGKDIEAVIDSSLRPLRNGIAHGLLSKKGDLEVSADELLHAQAVNRLFPMTKCIVRRMLKTDFPSSFLSHLPD
jgi:hypothetical protein